jgi:RNA polymerase sigma-70 factor (ECF subfamily)
MAVAQSADTAETFGDAALIALARQGSETAVRDIVRRYNRRLYRVARAILRDESEAEDVVQDTYVRAFTTLATFRGDAQLGSWLTRIAMNEALGRLRRRKPTVDVDVLDTEPMLEGTPMPTSPETNQARVILEECVTALPDAFRAVFVLRQVEEMSTEETAEQLGIKPETVKTRLHRAHALLRQSLDARFGIAFADLFPFDGARCERVADRVVERLQRLGSLPAAAPA